MLIQPTNDRNVYDDVEALPVRNGITSRAAEESTSSSASHGNNGSDGANEDDKPNADAIASEFAVQRTVALMLSWMLTVFF